ncbi:MAG: hypothetical protein ABIF28_18265 [Pseudomonadota bacterium]|uniref:hypothetical protein n=1 Tax=Methyloversatilis sp. TaxID=2569862 RepID=UPI0027341F51|nr:hypothetical protein [Methyloversatilis sp.]MDP3873802.1 hypothetical protein [Methyloversatilis sp.]
MRQFEVDDDVVEMVWLLARPKPFESLTFNDALRRMLAIESTDTTEPAPEQVKAELLARIERIKSEVASSKRAASPNPSQWAASVPELSAERQIWKGWRDICDHLGIDPAGDSARRKLKTWVALHRPAWPPVPETDSRSADERR